VFRGCQTRVCFSLFVMVTITAHIIELVF